MTGETESGTLLKAFFDRLMNLYAEKDEILHDINDVLTEAKQAGFDKSILRKVVQRAKKDPEELREIDALIETYEAVTRTGAGEVGILTASKGADGRFEVKMVSGPAAAEGKTLTTKAKARAAQMALAEAAARARRDQ